MKLFCVNFKKKELEMVFDDQELVYSSQQRKHLEAVDTCFQSAIEHIYEMTKDKDFTEDCYVLLADILVKLGRK